MRISEAAIALSGKRREVKLDPFRGVHGGALHPHGVGPTPEQLRGMALDQGSIISSSIPGPLQSWSSYNPAAITNWAYNNLTSGFAEGTVFLGYPTLAAMAQRAEYMNISTACQSSPRRRRRASRNRRGNLAGTSSRSEAAPIRIGKTGPLDLAWKPPSRGGGGLESTEENTQGEHMRWVVPQATKTIVHRSKI
jgi:hypothetical protein